MIDLVLNDLGSEALKALQPGLKFRRLVADLDLLEAAGGPGAAQQGKAAFLGPVFSGGLDDLRIEHHLQAVAVVEGNDPPGSADHISRHAYAGLPVESQRFRQVPGGLQVGGGGGGGSLGEKNGVVDQFFYHCNAP